MKRGTSVHRWSDKRGTSVRAWPDKRGVGILAFILIFAFVIILMINFASASVSLGKPAYSIDKKYGISQGITGWINMSLKNENTDALITDSLGNQISLIDLLKLNSNINYSCSPSNCDDYYSTSNAEISKKITSAGSEYSCSNGSKIGDANSDGVINNADSIVVQQIANGIISSPSNICCADADSNGVIQAADSSLILKIAAGTALSPGICSGKETNAISYAMVFSGEMSSINSIGFDINAKGIPSSCSSQFAIDIFDDRNIDFQNNLASDEICTGSKTYGCYNKSISSEEYTVDSDSMYCQQITLPRAPGFRIGAWVKKESGSGVMKMSIYDKDGNEVENGTCSLPDASSSGGEVYCNIDYSIINSDKYYVCVFSDSETGVYHIKGYDAPSDGCGFYGLPPADSLTSSYDIFVESKKFAALPSTSVSFSNELSTGESLNELAQDYIIQKNGGLNCSKGCIVPIKIKVNSGFESLNIGNIKINYQKTSGVVSSNTLYDLNDVPAKVNLSYGKLYLDGSGLKVKSIIGSFSYTLKFNEQKIFTDSLSLQKRPEIKSISPTKTTYLFNTIFNLNAVPLENITKYEWNFGDNSTTTTTINKVSHTYEKAGVYTLKVSVRDKNNISSSSSFSINVTSPNLLINKTIQEMKANIAKIKEQIDTYDLFYRTSLNNLISTANLSAKVKVIEDKYKTTDESNYSEIVSELNELRVPDAISVSESAPSFVFYPEKENIDIDVMKSIEEGTYKESDLDYVNSILVWNSQNIENELTFEEISARYAASSEPLLRVFEFKISEKKALSYNPYFVIKDMENLEFESNYGAKSEGGYQYITLTEGKNEIIFSTTEDVDFENVPAFISPGLSKLTVTSGEIPDEEPSPFPTTTFLIVLAIVVAVGILAYLGLHTWYKRKYEGHLFRNKNDVYNLLHFIDSQRRKGTSEREIHQKLKKSGWSSEQIKYAVRKHSGKETGMPGI